MRLVSLQFTNMIKDEKTGKTKSVPPGTAFECKDEKIAKEKISAGRAVLASDYEKGQAVGLGDPIALAAARQRMADRVPPAPKKGGGSK